MSARRELSSNSLQLKESTMPKTWEEFADLAASIGGRIVSSNDLHRFQIGELKAKGHFFVDPRTSYGWGLLPWSLTTAKDEERFAKSLANERRDITDI